MVIQIENDGPLQVKGWLDISDEQIVEYGIFHLKQEVTGDPITKQDGLDAELRKPLEGE